MLQSYHRTYQRKDGREKSIFDYEKLLYDSLLLPEFYNPSKHNFKHKHLWVKKATGLGVTEFMLRLMAWLCLRNNNNRNSQMCIVTGPNQDIAIKLIKRMKGLFEHRLGITFANKEKGYIAINPAFDKLIISLRTAVAEENILDKESTSYSDIFDAYRLALKYYQLQTRGEEDDRRVHQEEGKLTFRHRNAQYNL